MHDGCRSSAAMKTWIGVRRAVMRVVFGMLALLVVASPALAELGCISDAAVHATIEGPQAFTGSDSYVADTTPHREPVGHGSACHLSHAGHSQLPASDRVLPVATDRRATTQYWLADTAQTSGREPDGMIRPPRA